MPAFKKFAPGDQLDNVLIMKPRYEIISGSNGWAGSPEGSASLSLYGGARRSGIVTSAEYQSLAPNAFQTGNPIRGLPMTASIRFARVSNDDLNISQINDSRWGSEHWSTLMRLFDDYKVINPEYVTSSYDYYSVFFSKFSRNIVICSNPIQLTGSFTIESWIKPFEMNSNSTIQALSSSFVLGIDAPTRKLTLATVSGTFTSSLIISDNRWSHVAFSYDSSVGSGSFYIDGASAGVTPRVAPASASSLWSIGNVISNPALGFASGTGRASSVFNGMMGECRLWDVARTVQQVSSSAGSRLFGDDRAGPISYLMFNEGPLTGEIGLDSQNVSAGSGALDYAGLARGRSGDTCVARFAGFDDRLAPVWHPNDNPSFISNKAFPSTIPATAGPSSWGPVSPSPLRQMLVVDIPSAFYGRQIVPGSVRLVCKSFSGLGVVRTLVDDGRGGLYLSGSATFDPLNPEEYHGVDWNKVGNVFYGEGLVVIKDPSIMDFALSSSAVDTLTLSFTGDSRVPVKTLMCRIDHGEFNCTTNPTFSELGSSGEKVRRHASGSIRVSTVGIYNSDRELVAVARLADPVRIRPRDRINIKVRMDF